MAFIMGIDTGGTYTDGVVVDTSSKKILCKAKALTTKQDLMIGISECIGKLDLNDVGKVELVCLSTTLATNAIVEGRGGRVGLLLIGRGPEGNLPVDLWFQLQGKLDIKGREKEDIKEEEVHRAIESLRDRVDAIAISGYASVRNPVHELRVKKIVQEKLNIPVVCAHELSSSLGFHERTVTSALNAILIPIIKELIQATKRVLKNWNIEAPIMLVKGDGSLMQESFAVDRPIETILSGPAASILGGIFLTNKKDALVLDMGGTTTDIANVENGSVKIRKKGASVGGWLTHTQAAEICTFGLGGDSYLHFDRKGELRIGPQKVEPLCVAGKKYPNLIQELKTIKKDEEYELYFEQEYDCFYFIKKPLNVEPGEKDEKILQALEDGPHSLFFLARELGRDAEALELSKLVDKGIIGRISMTPTDILHVVGKYNSWNGEISRLAVEIMANKVGKTVPELLEMVLSSFTKQLCISCLQSIAEFEDQSFTIKENAAAEYFINKALETKQHGLLATSFTVRKPIVAIGAPVAAWMPAVCNKLHTELIIPEHAEVANAVGAAVGQVVQTIEAIIRPGIGNEGYILHAPWERKVFNTLEEALEYSIPAIKQYAANLVINTGSGKYEIVETHKDFYIETAGTNKRTYIETVIRATAIGSPIWVS